MQKTPTLTQVDIAKLQALVTDGYLTMRPHPTANLVIWNYTPRCQFEPYWTPETLMCRGLITTSEGHIIARPFPKFFNLGEYQGDLPLEPFTVTAKMDGSLGICFFYGGKFQIATRGSFASEQAIKANEMLTKYADLPLLTQRTYLFEIIYPENRIVVDYGAREDLVLLAEIITDTGHEVPIHDPGYQEMWSCPVVKRYDGIQDLAQLRAIQEDNAEGFVIRFEGGLRLKLKFEEYLRLHSLLTECSARKIWENLKESKSIQPLLDRVPEGFAAWVKSISKDLSTRYEQYHRETKQTYENITNSASILTPCPVGAVLTLREVETIKRAMDRYMHERFSEHQDIQAFLEILYSHSAKEARPLLKEAIWERLYPPHMKPFYTEGEREI